MTKTSKLMQRGFVSGFTMIDMIHERVHNGQIFSVGLANAALADDSTIEILVTVVDGLHLRARVSTGGDALVSFFEDTVTSDDGTALGVINLNRFSTNVPTTTFFSGPTTTDDGDLLIESYIVGGEKKQAVGGSGGTFEEWVLSPGNYLIRLQNLAGTAQICQIAIDFYEPDPATV